MEKPISSRLGRGELEGGQAVGAEYMKGKGHQSNRVVPWWEGGFESAGRDWWDPQ